jgi:hypothetical protein
MRREFLCLSPLGMMLVVDWEGAEAAVRAMEKKAMDRRGPRLGLANGLARIRIRGEQLAGTGEQGGGTERTGTIQVQEKKQVLDTRWAGRVPTKAHGSNALSC